MADDNDFNLRMQLYKETEEIIERKNLRNVSLMSDLKNVLDEGTVYIAKNKDLGEIQLRRGNKAKGLTHIINRRYEERVLNKSVQMSPEEAQREITAISFLVADCLDKGTVSQTPRGNWEIEKGGIKAIIDKDKDGTFVLTGFDDNKNKKEATESINAVIAQYGNTPEFLEMYAQVGAVIASYNILPQSQEKASRESASVPKTQYNALATEYNGLLKEYDENIRDYNRLLSAYNKSQEEIRNLKSRSMAKGKPQKPNGYSD